jgi:plasmid rolling circle replication initiator protein Rep
MWRSRFWRALPALIETYPKSRWLFLTLTIKNCEIGSLRSAIEHLNQSWRRLVKRKEFKHVQGWVRTTEVTRGADGTAHPHFHCLLMVSPTYFTGKGYIKQIEWTDTWKECLRVDYQPVVDVRSVKEKAKPDKSHVETLSAGISDAITETLKYSVKPSDMTSDDEWFIELTKQTHKMRFIASGGALKDILKEADESDEGMLGTEGEGEKSDPELFFDWREKMRRYTKKSD